MIKNINLSEFYSIDNLYEENIYFFSCKDLFITEKLNNKIINLLSKKYTKYNIKTFYIYSNKDLIKLINYIVEYNLLIKKEIIIINLLKIENYIFLNKYLNILFYNKKNNILLFNKYYFLLAYEEKKFLNNLNKYKLIYLKLDKLLHNDFVYFINKEINNKLILLNDNIYDLLFLIYKNNMFDINNFFLYIKNLNIKIINSEYIYFYLLENINFNINYDYLIYIIFLKEKNITNIILSKIKLENINILYRLINNIYNNILFLIIYKKYSNKLSINTLISKFSINLRYINILIEISHKINITNLYNILENLCLIELYIKRYDLKYKNFIINKIELISIYFLT